MHVVPHRRPSQAAKNNCWHQTARVPASTIEGSRLVTVALLVGSHSPAPNREGSTSLLYCKQKCSHAGRVQGAGELDQVTANVSVTFSSTFVYSCAYTAFACESSMQSVQHVRLATPPMEAPMSWCRLQICTMSRLKWRSPLHLTILYACSMASMLLLLKRF